MQAAARPDTVLKGTGARGRLRRRASAPWILIALSAAVALALLSPLLFLALDARSAGWGEISSVLFRSRSWYLLRHTIVLSALVVAFAASIGVGAALCTERTALPARRLWTVLLVLPAAIP